MNTDTSIPFRGFDERDEVRIYDNDTLPHWRQTGCAYFVTFRQADSLPEPVQREMEYERKLWLTNHGIAPEARKWKDAFAKLPQKTRREYERRVGTTLDKHLDAGHGASVLGHKAIGKIIADALLHFHGMMPVLFLLFLPCMCGIRMTSDDICPSFSLLFLVTTRDDACPFSFERIL